MIAYIIGRYDAEVSVGTVSHMQDRQQLLLSMRLLSTMVVVLCTSSLVLVVAYPQTLDGVHVNRISDPLTPLIFIALNLERRWTAFLGLMQQNGPLDFVDDFLLVQESLIKLVLDEGLDFA